jgi:uncharacterized membrane protein
MSSELPIQASRLDTPDHFDEGVNVNQIERAASIIVGGTLLLAGIRVKKRPITKSILIATSADLLYRGLSGQVYEALGINTAGNTSTTSIKEIERVITIASSPEEAYQKWREPQTLPQIMQGFATITMTDKDHVHWATSGPLGMNMAWDTQITEDLPGKKLRWRSTNDTDLPVEGSVHFYPAQGSRGTEVTLTYRFVPPGGIFGSKMIDMVGNLPDLLVEKPLRRFKSLLEAGEIPTLKNNPSAHEA